MYLHNELYAKCGVLHVQIYPLGRAPTRSASFQSLRIMLLMRGHRNNGHYRNFQVCVTVNGRHFSCISGAVIWGWNTPTDLLGDIEVHFRGLASEAFRSVPIIHDSVKNNRKGTDFFFRFYIKKWT